MNQTYVIGLPFNTRLVLSADLEEALQQVELRQYKLDNRKPLLNSIANVLRAGVRQQFAQGGNPAWKPNAPSTIAAKLAAGLPARLQSGRIPRRLMQNGGFGGGNSVLIASGQLRDSWGRKDNSHHVESVDEDSSTVEIGSDLPYAVFHQTGTRPYTISPKAGGMLAFMGVKGMVFTRKAIRHPGLAARPVVITNETRQRLADTVESYFADDRAVKPMSEEYDFS